MSGGWKWRWGDEIQKEAAGNLRRGRVIGLTAIVDGRRCTMLAGNSIEEAGRSCIDRFGSRFEGFAPIPVEVVARAKWSEYRAKEISREELNEWLAGREGEAEIRACFNRLRG